MLENLKRSKMVDCSTVSSSVSDDSNLYITTNSTLLHGCAFEVCNAIHNLKLCSGCRHTWYCSEEHQRNHWRTHRRNCKLKMADPTEYREGTSANANTLVSVDQQYRLRPSNTTVAFSTRPNFTPNNIVVRPSVACNTDSHTHANVAIGAPQTQIAADNIRSVNLNNKFDQVNQANIRPMLHPASMQATGFSPNQALFTASEGPYYVADIGNVFENRTNIPKSNSLSQLVMQESNMARQRHLPNSISTPFVVASNISKLKDNHDAQVNSDPYVDQDTDQFSESIRRSSSYPLSPLSALEAHLVTSNSGDTLDTSDTIPQNIIQQKVCSFTLGDDLPTTTTSSIIAGLASVVERRETPILTASGNLQPHLENPLIDYVTQWLQTYGICVLDKFLTEEQGMKVLEEMKSRYKRGDFMAGQLVRGREDGSSKEIRGDLIAWSDGSEPNCSNIGHLISTMDSIVMGCQGKLAGCKVSGRTKAMLACYPGNGTRYLRHVDNPSGDGRRITCIYYLNKNWNCKENGGLLRIYPINQDIVANIEPLFNRLLLFWSDRRNPHEVFPAYATRYAVTVWYFDLEERIQAKIQT